MKSNSKSTWWILSGIYAAVMLYLLLGRSIGDVAQFNYVPFDTIQRYFYCLSLPPNSEAFHWAIINFLGNIFLFLPLGMLPPLLWRWAEKFRYCLLFVISVMLCIELLQLVLRVGVCDVDDLLLNTAGGVIGFALHHFLYHTKKEHR